MLASGRISPNSHKSGETSVCVCVNLTSGGDETLATPTYRGGLALVPLPLGAAIYKIKSATLTLPSAQARALRTSASPSPRICGSISIRLHSLTLILVIVLDKYRARRALRGEGPKAPLPCQIQIHWLVPPKRLNRQTPLPHHSHTEFLDWLINNENSHSLPKNVHIMWDHLWPGLFQHICRARVQQRTVGFLL